MEKRIFAAVLISIGLLWGWAALAPKFFPELVKKPVPPKPAVTATTSTTATTAPASATTATTARGTPIQPAVVAAPTVPPIAASAITFTPVDTPIYTARFSNRGAQLVSFQLKRYTEKNGAPVELVKAREANRTDYPFALEATDAGFAVRANSALYQVTEMTEKEGRVLQFRWSDGRVTVTKTFRFNGDYLFDFAVNVTPPTPYRVAVGPGIRTLAPDEKDSQFIITGNGVAQIDDSLKVVAREKSDPYRGIIPPTEIKKLPFGPALRESLQENGKMLRMAYDAIARLVRAEGSIKELSGPVNIARISGEMLRRGWMPFIALLAAISLQLGVMNLLPIPVLDGGHIMILLIEGVVRRELSLRVKERIQQVGFAVLAALMIVVIYNDVITNVLLMRKG